MRLSRVKGSMVNLTAWELDRLASWGQDRLARLTDRPEERADPSIDLVLAFALSTSVEVCTDESSSSRCSTDAFAACMSIGV